jgi:prophage regulatory protein
MTEPTLLRLPAVLEATQLSRSSIYAAIKAGEFPSPVRVGRRAVRWRAEDIAAWRDTLRPTVCVGDEETPD